MDLKNRNVIIIGHNYSFGGKIAKFLQSQNGFSVYMTSDPIQSLELIKTNRPILVYIDPGFVGAEFTDLYRWMSSLWREIGFAFIFHLPSLISNRLEFDRLNMAGVDDVIVGEISLAEISSRIKRVLKNKRMENLLILANTRLVEENHTDELTGLLNVRGLRFEFSKILRSFYNGDIGGLALFMIDLDNFKSINDNCNHLVGSHVLRQVGRILNLSDYQVKARYGGDEFVVIVRCETIAVANQFAQSILNSIREVSFKYNDYEVRCTASVGAAFAGIGVCPKKADFIEAADCMLYKSKDRGKNKASLVDLTALSRSNEAEATKFDTLC